MVNVRINKTFGPYKAGQVVKVATTEAGIPLDVYWRRRLADAATDGCCELEQATPSKTRRSKTVDSSASED